jgi:hypothetical protein
MKLSADEWRTLLLNSGIHAPDGDIAWLEQVNANQRPAKPPKLHTEPQLMQRPEPWSRPQ